MYSLGVDYGRIATLSSMYRAQHGVDPPTSVVREWMTSETTPAMASHLSEARGAATLAEQRASIGLEGQRVGLQGQQVGLEGQRLELLKQQLEQQRANAQAQATGNIIKTGATVLGAYPQLESLGKSIGLFGKAGTGLTGAQLATPALTYPSTFTPTLTGVTALQAPLAPASLEAGTVASTAPATSTIGLGTALPVAGLSVIGSLGGGMLGQAIGGKTGKVIGNIGGGAAAGAAAGSFIFPGVGTVAGGIIGGVMGALNSLF